MRLSPSSSPKDLLAAVLLGMVLSFSPAGAQDAPPPAPAIVGDPAAALYMSRCAACHTVGGGFRSGPDLQPSTTWQRADLWSAVKRMERNAGPMTDQQVDDLTDFLKDPTVRTRMSEEEGRRRMMATATLEPASASLGMALFHGKKAFRNGGPNCAGCHAVDGLGGTLAVDLTSAFQRFGEMGLKSALEKPTFPTMMPIYASHPLTSQEAAHVTAYLESAGKESPSSKTPPIGLLAGGMAALMIGLLAVAGIRKRPGVRARLIREANRR